MMPSRPIRIVGPLALAGVLLAAPAEAQVTVDAGRGPITVQVPAGYDPASPAPLVILLHGYGSNGALQESYMQFGALVDTEGFLYCHPNGNIDPNGNRFWNGTDACCDLFGSGVDDVGYLTALIDEIEAVLAVDPLRVYFVGHSNGGFMSHRMACALGDRVAAIASLAGAAYSDPLDCGSDVDVHVLQIHGTADGTIFYGGGAILGNPYPGAVATVEQWALRDGCSLATTAGAPLDIDTSLAGAETSVTRYTSGCGPNGSAELWTINGGAHVPALGPAFAQEVVDWLLAHPKATITRSYCTAGTTANGCAATLSGTGTPSASLASPFSVDAAGVEGARQGILFYGLSGPNASPWGAGTSFLCVKSPTQRTGVQGSGGTAGLCDGAFALDWNAYLSATPSALGNPFAAGQSVWFQGWFRDPPSPKTTSLTNGLEFVLAP